MMYSSFKELANSGYIFIANAMLVKGAMQTNEISPEKVIKINIHILWIFILQFSNSCYKNS